MKQDEPLVDAAEKPQAMPEREELYLIVTTGDGAGSYIVSGVHGVEKAYSDCIFGNPTLGDLSEDDRTMLDDVFERIQDIDEWELAHDSTRLAWQDNFEDGSFSAYRILDTSHLAHPQPDEVKPALSEDAAVEVMVIAYDANPECRAQVGWEPMRSAYQAILPHFVSGKGSVEAAYREGFDDARLRTDFGNKFDSADEALQAKGGN